MAFYDSWVERLKGLRNLTPSGIRGLANAQVSDVVSKEVKRSRSRIEALQQRYPSAGPRELAQRLIDQKKSFASMVGGASGVFGLFGVPADLVIVAWLELTLLSDIATLYKANLKTDRARHELLDLYGYANGIAPTSRAAPRVVGHVAAVLLARSGFTVVGRAMPLVAAPVSAYLNSEHLQRVGEEAVRHYEGFDKAREKTRKAAGT